MHNTGNPLPSKDILDLYDNSENIDHFVNSQQDETPDRFGQKRLTLAGLIKRSMALRNEINDFSGALTFKPEWSDVPMNVSEGVGGEGGALNLQAEALGNRSEINKVTSRETLRRSYAEAGYNLVDGSFEAGGTLVNANDVLLQERTGKAFSGPAGTVVAGTNPASGGFVDRSTIAAGAGTVRDGRFALRDFVSVKDFGAVGDGVTDDTAAIQSAFNTINSGMCVHFGGGVFKLSGALSITNKTDFQIDGSGATIIAENEMPVIAGNGLLYLTDCSRFTVKNLTFDGNRVRRVPSEVAAHTITVNSCKRFIFENVYSNNAVCDGFYFSARDNTDITTYCQNFQIIGCYADNCYRQGASVINGHDFQFIGGAYTNTNGTNPQSGVDVESNPGGTIGNTRGSFIGVTFSGNAGSGIQISDVGGGRVFSVDCCYFSKNTKGAIVTFADQTIIRNSYFEGHSDQSITQGVVRFGPAVTTKSGIIDGCLFENNTSTSGDVFTHAVTSGIRISNNTFRNSGRFGVNIDGTNQICENNIFSNCAFIGINVTGSNNTIQCNAVTACISRGIYDAGINSRLFNNIVTDISNVSGAYIQSVGSDPLIVGNICASTLEVSDNGIRVDNTALAVHSNICRNLNSTDPYIFIKSMNDEVAYNNIGGTKNDRRSIRMGMATPTYTTSGRPSASAVASGQTIFNTTTKKLNTSDGVVNWYNPDGTIA